MSGQSKQPAIFWGELSPCEHRAQIYEQDLDFITSLEEFVWVGLQSTETVIVVATASHRSSLEERLMARGIDLHHARTQNHYIDIDADTMLSKFMVQEWPDAILFKEIITNLMTQALIAVHAEPETLYDQPGKSKTKMRITGPFTVEAVPFPTVMSLEEAEQPKEADVAIARSGESSRQHRWRDELLKTGIRGKGGQMLKFAGLDSLPTRHVHLSGTLADTGERVVVSFGPEHAGLEQRQVEMAMREAGELFPRPKMIVFCAFSFDPEAAKDIDQTKGITALKAQMNTDLLTEDLKKARSSNQSFWLMGQPDVDVRKQKDGLWVVEVNGFDYFDTVKGELISGGKGKIAAWMLDTDYDERSLYPQQVFFPMAGSGDGWFKLKKDIKAELNEELLSQFHGTVSLPFEAGENKRVAVKIVDDRGIESLKVMSLED